jgi:exodeoxyribonuclease VIII
MYSDDWSIPEDVPPVENRISVQNNITIEMCLSAGANGIDIPNEVYHSLPGISGSNLPLLAESNRHLDNKHLFNMGESPALMFGTLLHTMVLEPDDVDNRYVVMPEFGTKAETGVSKVQAARDFYEKNSGKIVIEASDFARVGRMARNARAICGDIIDQGIKERSLFVKLDNLILKSRLDIDLEDVGDDFDLKSITLGVKEFSDATLEAHIKKFHYHWSAAFRNIIRRALNKPVRDSYLIFVSTGMGHMVRVIRIKQTWINEAEEIVSELLDRRSWYKLTGQERKEVVEIDDRYRKVNQY